MCKRSVRWLIMAVMLSGGVAQAAANGPVPLPVRKVVLFKNGIGYFQHLGPITGSQSVQIRLSSGQLDDVLKSLTVLDLDGGRIASVSYDSEASLARRMAELPVDPLRAENLVALLNQLKGSQVALDAPAGTVSGRLVSAELRTVAREGGVGGQRIEVALLGEEGRLQVVYLDSAGGLRLLDSELSADLARSLELLAGSLQGDVRHLQIHAEGSGERRLSVGYTAEAPIWKTSYRMVLQEQGGLMQGWAIVDNTTPMAWEDVELSLVSSAPVSFIYRLSQPIYGERPEVPVSTGVRVAPEIHAAALESAEGPSVADIRAGGLAESRQARLQSSVPMAAFDMGEAMKQSTQVAAEGSTKGEQFEYRIRDRVTIGRNQSALIPIVQAELNSEKVTIFNESRDAIPRLAIWISNDTGQTLDGGSFTILDAGVYAGEGLFETIQPGERRLLSYAVDLGVEISTRVGSERREVETVTASRGVLRMTRKLVETRNYTVRNKVGQAKAIIVEHPLRPGWTLSGPARPVETSADYHRFRIACAANANAQLVVTEEHPEESVYRISEASVDQLGIWVRDRALSDQARQALNGVIERQRRVNELIRELEQLGVLEERIFSDQERLRGNLSGLSQGPEESRLRQRYIDQLESQENQLGELRSRRESIDQQLHQARQSLAEAIDGLSF
jgi:hypothetical protein